MQVLMEVLTGGPESILHKALVDTGLCTSVEGMLEPTSEENLGMLNLTLAPNQTHHTIEEKVFAILETLPTKEVTSLLTKVKARLLTADLFGRDSSLKIAAELTEYVAAGDWTMYTKTQSILDAITPKGLIEANKVLLGKQQLTIGYFIGTKA
jgi:predicted Zn-dependent peptidase